MTKRMPIAVAVRLASDPPMSAGLPTTAGRLLVPGCSMS